MGRRRRAGDAEVVLLGTERVLGVLDAVLFGEDAEDAVALHDPVGHVALEVGLGDRSGPAPGGVLREHLAVVREDLLFGGAVLGRDGRTRVAVLRRVGEVRRLFDRRRRGRRFLVRLRDDGDVARGETGDTDHHERRDRGREPVGPPAARPALAEPVADVEQPEAEATEELQEVEHEAREAVSLRVDPGVLEELRTLGRGDGVRKLHSASDGEWKIAFFG